MKAIQPYYSHKCYSLDQNTQRDHHGCDHMTVGFTTPCAISAYHQQSCEFEFRSWRDALYTMLYEKVRQQVEGCLWVVRFPPLNKLTAFES